MLAHGRETASRTADCRESTGSVGKLSGPATDRLSQLAAAVERERCAPRAGSRTARLLARGVPKMARKVIEEAGEVSIEALRGDRAALVLESADLLYNLTVLWSELGIRPADVWAEMDRREALLGLAEKLPKPGPAEVR